MGEVHTTQEKFENVALFLRPGLHFTLVDHENGACRKSFTKQRNLKTPAFRFNVKGKHSGNRNFRKRRRRDYHVIPLMSYSRTNPKWPVIDEFSNFSGVVWTENVWCVFWAKTHDFSMRKSTLLPRIWSQYNLRVYVHLCPGLNTSIWQGYLTF